MSNENSVFDVIALTTLTNDQTQIIEVLTEKTNLYNFKTCASLPPNGSDNSSGDSDDEKSYKKTKKLVKPLRKRDLKENSKWTSQDQVNYWKFYIDYQIKRPYQKISWNQWKRDSIYKDMAKFIGKTPKQCKSKDQNIKSKQTVYRQGKDIVQIAVQKFELLQEKDDIILTYLQKYYMLGTEVSEHMRMLEKRMEIIRIEQAKLDSMFNEFKMEDSY